MKLWTDSGAYLIRIGDLSRSQITHVTVKHVLCLIVIYYLSELHQHTASQNIHLLIHRHHFPAHTEYGSGEDRLNQTRRDM
jgi:hypothetical protein